MSGPEIRGQPIEETLRRRFESAWVAGRPQPIEQFLPGEEDADYLATLEELVRIELQLAWKMWRQAEQRAAAGPHVETIARPLPVEAYLEKFPRLNRPEIVLRLVQQERSARKQCGEQAAIEEYRRRFPDLEISSAQSESSLPMMTGGSSDGRLADTLAIGPPGGAAADGNVPSRFGNYDLLEEIGRGGMGVVYRARQRTADRIVALKVIRRDRLESLARDTKTTALDRFRHEAQAAAQLEHEHIVTVYEVGEVDGHPFFSMQYVEGRSLAQMLKGGPIENRRAAAYLEPIARAVHEAHLHGILHRDLKPQNIPVEAKSDRALVADFGLAKLSEGAEELTRAGEIMGTPSYMSPEQAKDSAQVTAQTDIYALGATLYHILTARPPFQAATPVETLRQVIDEEPAPPRQLNPSIHRDLETVCLKCLQKEPSRRYGTAELLADDLRRYLDGEPILARPIGPLGRTLRWCRRKPAMAALVASTATCFLVALVVAVGAWLKTSAALEQSEESFALAQGAVDEFFGDVMEDTLLNQPGMHSLRQELLQKARRYYREFVALRGDDPRVRDDLAMAHFRLGQICEQIDVPQKALASYAEARKMQEQLVSEHPHDRLRLQRLGKTLNAVGRVWHRLQKLEYARQAYQEAAVLRKRLSEVAPEESEFQRTLANSYMNIGLVEKDRGRLDEARRQYEKAQAVRQGLLDQGERDPKLCRDLGMGHYNLATLAMLAAIHAASEEEVEEAGATARQNLEEAIALFEELFESQPEVLANQARLAICYRILADLRCRDDVNVAMGLYQKAIRRTETLALRNPKVPDYQADLARLHMVLGELEYDQQGQGPSVALRSFQRALGILEGLVKQYPNVSAYDFDRVLTLVAIAAWQRAEGQSDAARDSLKTAEKYLTRLVEQYPDNNTFRAQLETTKATLEALQAGRREEEEE